MNTEHSTTYNWQEEPKYKEINLFQFHSIHPKSHMVPPKVELVSPW